MATTADKSTSRTKRGRAIGIDEASSLRLASAEIIV
jgi:hypothetical protein